MKLTFIAPLATCMFAIFLPLPASASNWQRIDGIGERLSYVDYASIVTTANGRKKAWMLNTFDQLQTVPGYPQYRSMKSLIHFDCKEKTRAEGLTVLYDGVEGTGAPVNTEYFPVSNNSFRDVIPDSIAELQLEIVCAYKGKSKR